METIQSIDEYIATQMDGKLVRKGKNPLLWIVLGVIVKLQAKKCSFCSNSQIAG